MDPAGAPPRDGRKWIAAALAAYAAALALAALSLLAVVVHQLGNLGGRSSPGAMVLVELVLAALAALTGYLAWRCAGLARAFTANGVPPIPRAARDAALAFALLACAWGLWHLTQVRPGLGILELAAGVLALLACGAWTSRDAGALPRSSLFAACAGLLWLWAGALRGPEPIERTAALALTLPSGVAIALTGLAFLAYAILQQTRGRGLGPAGVALAGLVGSVQALVGGIDAVAASAAVRTDSIPILLATAAAVALVAAGALGLAGAALALSRLAPPLVASAGAGFLAPEPGTACPRCGLVPPRPSNFCPDCGMDRRGSQ